MDPADETRAATGEGPVQFPPTLWTVVLNAKQGEAEPAQVALGELCVYYREAILSYFRIKCRHHHDAEDMAGAFTEHLLQLKRLGSFDRASCPRFRAYLSVALKHFFSDSIEKRKAEKRGGGRPEESFEMLREAGLESPNEDRQLQQAVDLGMVRSIHRRVMEELERRAPDRRRFDVLRPFIPYEQGAETYEQAARELKLSLAAIRKAVFDLRSKYVVQFRAAVAPTVCNVRAEVDDEARTLLDLLPEAIALENQSQN